MTREAPIEIVSASEEETEAAGRDLGRQLESGDLVRLEGPLGAGKTAFVRGMAEGLGGDPADVSSPTFAIVQEYGGRVTLRHVDLYRLSPQEVMDLGLEELLSEAVVAVEWPDRWPGAPVARATVRIDRVDEHTRRISIS